MVFLASSQNENWDDLHKPSPVVSVKGIPFAVHSQTLRSYSLDFRGRCLRTRGARRESRWAEGGGEGLGVGNPKMGHPPQEMGAPGTRAAKIIGVPVLGFFVEHVGRCSGFRKVDVQISV